MVLTIDPSPVTVPKTSEGPPHPSSSFTESPWDLTPEVEDDGSGRTGTYGKIHSTGLWVTVGGIVGVRDRVGEPLLPSLNFLRFVTGGDSGINVIVCFVVPAGRDVC